jgi:hypothetical protein
MLHLFTRFMSQNSQSFSGCLSHACNKSPPRCGSLNQLANVENPIGRKPLAGYDTYAPKVRVPTKQPQGSDKERGLTIPQRQEQCP